MLKNPDCSFGHAMYRSNADRTSGNNIMLARTRRNLSQACRKDFCSDVTGQWDISSSTGIPAGIKTESRLDERSTERTDDVINRMIANEIRTGTITQRARSPTCGSPHDSQRPKMNA
ncbi:hypothetical protein RvY_14534 [Ramazzottius varieornatus]|uniref:Uncharacterized protein n=1 Tax=Ramazzottius varieornatus TaxID=947166 RepID=A0A1D1VRM9_RAMVA|nr:hypothetical protein RvY_14534 [Ramazzottius varieornatus]